MKLQSLSCWCFLLLFLAPLAAPAADLPPDPEKTPILDEVIVSARGTDSLISQTPGGVGVVTRDAIAEQQPVSLTDAARRIPGVETSSDAAWGSAINIRGLGRNSVVFLIDGCRVNTATDINGQFGMIPPGDIERIEVLKGPISALYGSGAIGGVVNVITKKGRFAPSPQWHGNAAVAWNGNPEGTESRLDLSFNHPDVWTYAAGSYRDFNSYDSGDGERIANSQFRDAYGKAAVGCRWSDLNTTEFQAQYFEGRNIGIPGKGLSLPEGPDVTYPRTSRALLHLTHTLSPESGSLSESRLNLFYQKIQRRARLDDFPAAAPLAENRPGADHATWGLKWQNVLELDAHTLVAGLDLWQWDIGDSERYKRFKNGLSGVDSSLGDLKQFSGGVFAEDDWAFGDDWKLNLGGRLDYIAAESDDLYSWIDPPSPATPVVLKREGEDYDDIGWNAHIGLTWNFWRDWSMTAISAAGYRAPDLMDRFKYINLGGGIELYGNPELDPERSLFFEYGLHYVSKRLRLSASAYANCLDDLITEKAVSDTVRQMQNVDEARIYGAEASGEWWFAPVWSVYANLAYTDGENTTTDEPLPFIPPLNGLLGLRWEPNAGWWGRIEMEWAAEQDDAPDDREQSAGWTTVNLRAGYRFQTAGLRHAVMAGVDNLFDRDYRNYLATSRGIELKEPGLSLLATYTIGF